MASSHFAGPTIDDVMRLAIEEIQARGEEVSRATKGANDEIRVVVLEITNPRARISRTESRGKPFSCLGELCWYLSGTNDSTFIKYYIPLYKRFEEEGIIWGGYGPRLFSQNGDINQINNVIKLLRERPDSRRAAIQLFEASDLIEYHKDIPCTCSLQFFLRNDQLEMATSMRSNDIVKGFPHDIFVFTMIQEVIARTLDVEPGVYKHTAGSLHLYEDDRIEADTFLAEGWQSTDRPMPPMPVGDPWPSIRTLLSAEAELRVHGRLDPECLRDLDPYWADLIRLLQAFRYLKDKDAAGVIQVRDSMESPLYRPFIDKRVADLSK